MAGPAKLANIRFLSLAPSQERLQPQISFGCVRHGLAGRLDLRGLRLDQPDDMVDHVGVLDMVVGDAAEIDHMLAVAAAGDADVGLAGLARAVDYAAENRERHRRADMAKRLL